MRSLSSNQLSVFSFSPSEALKFGFYPKIFGIFYKIKIRILYIIRGFRGRWVWIWKPFFDPTHRSAQKRNFENPKFSKNLVLGQFYGSDWKTVFRFRFAMVENLYMHIFGAIGDNFWKSHFFWQGYSLRFFAILVKKKIFDFMVL